MRVFEVGFRNLNQKLGNDIVWSSRKYLAGNFDIALTKAQKEVSLLAEKKIKVEIDYIKSILRLD